MLLLMGAIYSGLSGHDYKLGKTGMARTCLKCCSHLCFRSVLETLVALEELARQA